MSVLDKLMFWKKQDDFSDLGLNKSAPGSDPFASGQNPFPPGQDPLASSQSGFDPNQNNLGMDNNQFNPGLGESLSSPTSNDPFSQTPMHNGQARQAADPFSAPQGNDPMAPRFTQQAQQNPMQAQMTPQQDLESKNMELISTKLDALRVSIDSMNQRLANLENIANGNEPQRRRGRYY